MTWDRLIWLGTGALLAIGCWFSLRRAKPGSNAFVIAGALFIIWISAGALLSEGDFVGFIFGKY